MNYLSHFYFDSKDERSDFVFGIALPDLMGSFNRRYRSPEWLDLETVPSNLLELQLGVNRHHELDKLFHGGQFFKRLTDRLKKELKALPFRTIKKYHFFYAHVLLELLLDRILLEREPELVDDFYEHLTKLGRSTINEYFEWNSKAAHPEDFWEHYMDFQKHAYLRLYAKESSIGRAMSRIYQRVHGDLLPEDDAQLFALIVPDFQAIIEEELTSFAGVLK